MNDKLKILFNGIIAENPTFVLMLGMCPTLGTTGSAINGMSMGLATMAVLICSNVVISLIKDFVPSKVRIPAYIVVIAAFVSVLQLVMEAYLPSLYAEAFASRHGVFDSCLDGIGIGLGFTVALTLLGAVREFLGTGKIFDATIYPEQFGSLVFVLAPGAFIALGLLIALFTKLREAK